MNEYFLIIGLTRMNDYTNAILQENGRYSQNKPADQRNPLKDKKMIYFFLSVILLIIVGVLDLKIGNRISFMPFYLIPISIAALFTGRPWGIIMAITSGFIWLMADINTATGSVQGIAVYWNALVRIFFFLLTVFLIRAVHDLNAEKEQARTDPLTGLANRRYFYDISAKEIDRSRRYGHPLSLVFLDCDNFKKVNDHFGHQTGDELIKAMAEVITNNTRNSDFVARWGGDEFVILLPETNCESVHDFVTRLNRSLPHIGGHYGWQVTASIGAVTYKLPPHSVDQMLIKADELMYNAKNNDLDKRIEFICY